MTQPTVVLTREEAQKVAELLEGFSLILQNALPQRLYETLLTMDQPGVFQPLRYDMPAGPQHVAHSADELVVVLRGQLPGGVWP